MPDRTDDPVNPLDRYRNRALAIACGIVVFVVIPLALLAANRGWA